MATFLSPDCGNIVSEKAPSCPRRGRPFGPAAPQYPWPAYPPYPLFPRPYLAPFSPPFPPLYRPAQGLVYPPPVELKGKPTSWLTFLLVVLGMLFFSLVITTIPAQANDERQVGKQTGAIVKEKSQYYAQLRRFIRSNWQPFQAYRAPNLVVEFIIFIQPDGTISDKRLRKSSGNQDFDQMVGWAIDRTKLPPLPPAFNGQTDRPALSISCDYLSEK